MVYQFFVNKIGSGVNVNEVLAQELNIPEIKKFKGRKVYAKFKDNIGQQIWKWDHYVLKTELLNICYVS